MNTNVEKFMQSIFNSLSGSIISEWYKSHPSYEISDFHNLVKHPTFQVIHRYLNGCWNKDAPTFIQFKDGYRLDDFLYRPGDRFQHCTTSVNISARFAHELKRTGYKGFNNDDLNKYLSGLKKLEREALDAITCTTHIKEVLTKSMEASSTSSEAIEDQWSSLLQSVLKMAHCQLQLYEIEVSLAKQYSEYIQEALESIFQKSETKQLPKTIESLHAIYRLIKDQQQINFQDILDCQFESVCQAHNEMQIHVTDTARKIQSIQEVIQLVDSILSCTSH